MYKKCRKRGGVNAKKSCGETKQRIHKKKEKEKKSCDFEYILIMSFM